MGFLQYIDFIFVPFRRLYGKFIGIKNIKGGIKYDINRSKALIGQGKGYVNQANAKLGGKPGEQQQPQQPQQPQAGGYQQPQAGFQPHAGGYQQPQAGFQPQVGGYQQPHAGGYQQQVGYQQQGAQAMQQPGMPGTPGMPQGAPQGMQPGMPPPGAPSGNPPIRTKGFWIFKKKFCTQCEQQLDKSWDACPYCAQIAQQAAVAPAKLQVLKTQAFVLDSSGSPGSMQLLGWLIPLQGPQRGELFTLSPTNVIGTDPGCNVVLHDKFMSSKHAEIKAEQGMWILRDTGSTNGTYVNNRRVNRHELVDNDFIKFGSAMLKFKSL